MNFLDALWSSLHASLHLAIIFLSGVCHKSDYRGRELSHDHHLKVEKSILYLVSKLSFQVERLSPAHSKRSHISNIWYAEKHCST